jgi:hypothetical protein
MPAVETTKLPELLASEDVLCLVCLETLGKRRIKVLSSWRRDDSGEVVEMTHTCLMCGSESYLVGDSPALEKALRQIELLEGQPNASR